jgi:hypothetical protein
MVMELLHTMQILCLRQFFSFVIVFPDGISFVIAFFCGCGFFLINPIILSSNLSTISLFILSSGNKLKYSLILLLIKFILFSIIGSCFGFGCGARPNCSNKAKYFLLYFKYFSR